MSLKSKVSKILKDDLIVHTGVVFIGTTLVGICNLLYQLASVRMLTPTDYGTFNALISLAMFTSMAVSPLGIALTRFFTEYITKKEFSTLVFVFLKLIKKLFIIAIVTFFVFLVFSSQIAAFLKTKPVYVIVCGIIIAFGFLSLLFPTLFQSFQKFKTYSFIGFFSCLGKLLIGILFMSLGWRVMGALSGFLVLHLLLILVSLFFIPDIFKKKNRQLQDTSKNFSLLPIYKYFFPVSLVMFSFTSLISIDIILVKHFFSPLDAGYYSIAQIVGKIALFLPSALAVVILPKSIEAHVNNTGPKRLLYRSLLLGGICCVIFVTISFLFPGLLLKVLTGKVNIVSKGLVGLFSLAMSFCSLLWIVINFLLATHNLKFVFPLMIAACLEAVLIYFYHSSLLGILWILLLVSVLAFLAVFLIAACSQIKPIKEQEN